MANRELIDLLYRAAAFIGSDDDYIAADLIEAAVAWRK
jgi:hypothetical protein